MLIKGEYWYSSKGKLYSCDGDKNKFGHEGFVIMECRKALTAALQTTLKRKNEYKEIYKISLVDERWGGVDSGELFLEKLELYTKLKLTNNSAGYDKLRKILPKNNFDDQFFQVCFSDEYASNPLDIVEYAIANWKWIRIVGGGGAGRDIQVPELTRDYIKKAAAAINAALIKEKKFHQKDLVEDRYNISTYKGNIYEITLGDMETGNMEDMERGDIEKLGNNKQVADAGSHEFYKGTIGDSYEMPTFAQFMLTE